MFGFGFGFGFRRLLVHDEQAHSRRDSKQRHGALVSPEAVPRAGVVPADACEGAQLLEGRGRVVASQPGKVVHAGTCEHLVE
tara:strand:+ start:279 stop:524 length:246 start_codon:yes stop_codon:yes gene_type:complete